MLLTGPGGPLGRPRGGCCPPSLGCGLGLALGLNDGVVSLTEEHRRRLHGDVLRGFTAALRTQMAVN